VALIAGTVATMVAVPERGAVLSMTVQHPKQVTRSTQSYAFTISMVTTRNIEDLELRVRTFRGLPAEALGIENMTSRNLGQDFEPVRVLGQMSSELGFSIEPERLEPQGAEEKWTIMYYDYGPVFELLRDMYNDSRFSLVTSVYAFLLKGSRPAIGFLGGAELFPQQRVTVTDVSIEVNGDELRRWERGKYPAAHMGRIPIGQVKAGNRIDIIYHIDGRRIGAPPLLNLVELSVDGRPMPPGAYLINV